MQAFMDRIESEQTQNKKNKKVTVNPAEDDPKNQGTLAEEESGDLQVAKGMEARVKALMEDDKAIQMGLGLDDGAADDLEVTNMMEQMHAENRLFPHFDGGASLVTDSDSAGGHLI